MLFIVTVVTSTSPDDDYEAIGEGPAAAAYDFEQARGYVSQTQRAMRKQRRRIRASLITGVCAGLVVVGVLHLSLISGSPVRIAGMVLAAIDVAAVLVIATAIYFGARAIARKTEEIEDLQQRLMQYRTAERDAKSRMPIGNARLLWTYHSDVLNTIDEYRDSALRYRKIHNRFQNVIIIGSLMTTAITTAALKFTFVEWVAIAISFAVGLSAGMTGYYKFRERSMNLQQAADDLEQEHKAVELGIRAYRDAVEVERLVRFAERAEAIKDEQRKREQQLEQPPDGRDATTSAAPNPA